MNSYLGTQTRERVVVVTGASAGVGRAVVNEFAKRGDRIALLARQEEGLKEAAEEVRELGGEALIFPLDVADCEAVERAAARIEEELGPIDVWVNNAMLSVFAPVKEMTAAEYKRVTDVTYLGYVNGTLAALKRMQPRNHGIIIQVGSALAYRSIPLQSAYCAAKHAIKGFTESLRVELLHDKSCVRVVQVHLPAVNTPQFDWTRSKMPNELQPMPPIFQPEVAARAIEWASRHPRRELWIGWPTSKVILANRLAPGLVDRYLAKRGYDSQQTEKPARGMRDGNLLHPMNRGYSAHGRFDDRSKNSSFQFWLTKHRGKLAALGVLGAAVGFALRRESKIGPRDFNS